MHLTLDYNTTQYVFKLFTPIDINETYTCTGVMWYVLNLSKKTENQHTQKQASISPSLRKQKSEYLFSPESDMCNWFSLALVRWASGEAKALRGNKSRKTRQISLSDSWDQLFPIN